MKKLDEKRKEFDQIQAPSDFEARLRSKLADAPSKKKRLAPWLIAVAVFCLALASWNYPALAFYGKTLLGYEDLMSESIQQLNEDGFGQMINKTVKLDDETTLKIEGVMSDLNQFELYYAIEGDGESTFFDIHFFEITGFLTKSYGNSGVFDTDINKGVQTFEPVNAFAKKLTLQLSYKQQAFEIEFPYEANKAVPTMIKKRLNETYHYDFGTIKFKSLYATNGSTRLEGTLKEQTDRNISYDFSQIVLVADGKELPIRGSRLKSIFYSTYKFKIDYEALPPDVKQLSIGVRQFNGMENVKQSIPAQVGAYEIGAEKLEILSINKGQEKTTIRISTDYDILLDQVIVKTKNDGAVLLDSTENYSEGTENNERTLVFYTDEDVESLYIENMYYNKTYLETINIPIK